MRAFLRYASALVTLAPAFAVAAERGAIYSPVGKRDPFKSPSVTGTSRDLNSVSPIEKFAVEQLQLRAVLRGLGQSRAMFEDPDGRTHILKEGDIIGRERATISRILTTEVIVTERSFNYLGEETLYEKILSLPVDQISGDVRIGTASGSGSGAPPAEPQQGTASPAPDSGTGGVGAAPPNDSTIRGNDGGGLTY